MDIEEKRQKAKTNLEVLGNTGLWILIAIGVLNKSEHLQGGYLPSLLAMMEQWQEEPFKMDNLTYWCPLLFQMKMIGIAESSPGDQQYSLSFEAQRLILWVTKWAKDVSDTNEWAKYLPKQYEELSLHDTGNPSRARAA
jgi:hypothetical protein